MFLPNSRYAKVSTVETTTSTGEKVVALKLRRLTPAGGEPQVVQSGDRLDLFAQARTGDATQFWHIADANTALDGRTLVAAPGDMLIVPKA
ncbi:MAG: LysM domain-containing protein [Burkholderiaceae bacterium]